MQGNPPPITDEMKDAVSSCAENPNKNSADIEK